MKIEVYSDGSSDGKSGGVGGWAYVVVVDGVKQHEASGSERMATNNTMEIMGASEGLKYVATNYPNSDVTLISDSQLVLRWADGTYKVKAQHLFPYIIALRKAFNSTKASTQWVKGHSGDQYNEECDKLAKIAREGKGKTNEDLHKV